jgi:hypothetical protein
MKLSEIIIAPREGRRERTICTPVERGDREGEWDKCNGKKGSRKDWSGRNGKERARRIIVRSAPKHQSTKDKLKGRAKGNPFPLST